MNQVQCNILLAWCLNVEETGPVVKDCAETKPQNQARNARKQRKSYILFHIMFLFYLFFYFGGKVLLPTIKLLMTNIYIINQIEIVLKEAS